MYGVEVGGDSAGPLDPDREQAYARIFTKTMMAQVRNWLRRLCVPKRDRRDLVQEVMLAAHQSFRKYDPVRGPPERWLNRIAVHAASHYRDRKRRRPEEPLPDNYDAELDAPSAEELIAMESERLLALELLREMDIELCSVLMAHDIEGISMVEYASRTKIPVSTAYKRRIRALAAFQAVASERLGLAGSLVPKEGARHRSRGRPPISRA